MHYLLYGEFSWGFLVGDRFPLGEGDFQGEKTPVPIFRYFLLIKKFVKN